MTRKRFIGQSARTLASRARQQSFLRVLVDCSGSRARAVEKTSIPLGTVLRWNSDPWFREQYQEVREALTDNDKRLRESLEATSIAMALGRYTGLLKPKTVRTIVDGLEQRQANAARDAAEHAELDRQIAALLKD